jgi:hypothetical protein
MIRMMTTNQYPTRYIAFDNPGVWVEQATFEQRGGYECAVYCEPVRNVAYPYLIDGVYIAIMSYRDIDYLLECTLTEPIQNRRQHNFTQRYGTYDEAKRAALTWLVDAWRVLDVVMEGYYV